VPGPPGRRSPRPGDLGGAGPRSVGAGGGCEGRQADSSLGSDRSSSHWGAAGARPATGRSKLRLVRDGPAGAPGRRPGSRGSARPAGSRRARGSRGSGRPRGSRQPSGSRGSGRLRGSGGPPGSRPPGRGSPPRARGSDQADGLRELPLRGSRGGSPPRARGSDHGAGPRSGDDGDDGDEGPPSGSDPPRQPPICDQSWGLPGSSEGSRSPVRSRSWRSRAARCAS
jgi:hypothetical protein